MALGRAANLQVPHRKRLLNNNYAAYVDHYYLAPRNTVQLILLFAEFEKVIILKEIGKLAIYLVFWQFIR